MRFAAFVDALRRQWLGSGKATGRRKKGRRPERRVSTRRPMLEALEDRTLLSGHPLSALPIPSVVSRGVAAFDGSINDTNPAVAVDPADPSKVVGVYVWHWRDPQGNEHSDLGGVYSRDGGQTWNYFIPPGAIFRQFNPNTTNPVVPFPFVTDAQVAMGSDGSIYILSIEGTLNHSDGVVTLHKFDFSGPAPFEVFRDHNLYFWDTPNNDFANNLTLTVDNNPSHFVDPQNGMVQDDPFAGTVYAGWTIIAVPPANVTAVYSDAVMAASSDGGDTFTPYVTLQPNPRGFPQSTTSPAIAVVGQTAVAPGSTPRVSGGTVVALFDSFDPTLTPSPHPFPGSLESARFLNGGSAYVAVGDTGGIGDAGPSPGTGLPDVPVTTEFDVDVNLPSNITQVGHLVADLAIFHAHVNQLRLVLEDPFGNDTVLMLNKTDASGNNGNGIGVPDNANLGILNGNPLGTMFDDSAARSINNGSSKTPFAGHFQTEGLADFLDGGLAAYEGAAASSVNGTWKLFITDFRNNGSTPPVQFVDHFFLRFAGNMVQDPSGPFFASGNVLPVRNNGTNFYLPAVNPEFGIAPSIVTAVDNTLGGYSPYQGRIYAAFVNNVLDIDPITGAIRGIVDQGDISLVVSDDGGQTWGRPDGTPGSVRLNDDSAFDGFSEGNRTQFFPSLTVDQNTGTLVASWYDARYDASNARTVVEVTTSIDGGNTFSPDTFVNQPRTATDAVNPFKTDLLEPLPDNASTGNSGRDLAFGLGSHLGLAAANGHIVSLWAGNQNQVDVLFNPLPMFIQSAVATYGVGPRVESGTMGPVSNAPQLFITKAPDGTTLADRFEIQFDRVVDPDSFTKDDVTVVYRSPTMPLTQPGITLDVKNVVPEDFGNFGPQNAEGATRFLVLFDPAKAVAASGTYTGTYSYAVGPLVNDRIRSAANGTGNNMDQNADAVPAQPQLDQFDAPAPLNGIFQNLPYNQDTLPLIVAGPHIQSTHVPGTPTPAPSNNVVVNQTTNSIDVVFDRDMDPTTVTPSAILAMIGPLGSITGPFTVTPNPSGTPAALAKRTFRIGFPLQQLSGTYTIILASSIRSAIGEQLDTNLNAGVDLLKGGTGVSGSTAPVTFPASNVPVTIGPNSTVSSSLTVSNPFLIQGVTVQLSITAANDPDLEATLIAPDGTRIKLFTNVGNRGPLPHSNFTNTVFDDNAATPIQLGVPPFNASFNPQIPLSFLKNKSSAGTWKLEIKNDAGRTNTLTAWSLTLLQATPGTGLGELVADQATVHFRIFTQSPANPLSHNTMTAVGPASNNSGGNSGRIGGLALDPSDPSGNTVYVGGASGGVWKTTNFMTNDPAGPIWVPLTDFGPTFAMNIGSIAVFGRNHDPRQSIVFVGTGEGDALAGGSDTATGQQPTSRGVGFLRSLDGGASWALLDSTTNVDSSGNPLPINSSLRDHVFVGTSVFKLLVDPNPTVSGETIVYAAVAGGTAPGLYRSMDTGKHWTLMKAGTPTDIAFANSSANASGNLQVIYAAFRGVGVFESPNQGAFWTLMAGNTGDPLIRDGDKNPPPALNVPTGQAPNGGQGRIVLATPAHTGNPVLDAIYNGWVYAAVATPAGAFDGLFMTKDFGQNWVKVLLPFQDFRKPTLAFPSNNDQLQTYDPLGGNGSFPAQGNYDISLAIDPTNPNIVYVGGTDDNARQPAGGLIRVDTSVVQDAHNLAAFNDHRADSGQLEFQTNSRGGAILKDTRVIYGLYDQNGFPPPFDTPYVNLIRDPNNPFLSNATILTSNVTGFSNTGANARWTPFNDVLEQTTDQHRVISFIDPLTGHARLIFGDDQGLFTGVDLGDGTLSTGIGTAASPAGSRNGNLQITQFYYGAAQPSVIAADIARALFYGMAQDNGFPASDPEVLRNGNLSWAGPEGDGTGVATDQTGSGTVYQYRWPCCLSGEGSGGAGGGISTPTDFFAVTFPGSGPIGRTFGLLQAGDDPAANKGQWPFLGGSTFAVNPITPGNSGQMGIAMSSQAGRIFRSQDEGITWFDIGDPGDLDGTYADAMAFGAPEPGALNNVNNFIYAGTIGGNGVPGHIFVTFQGGGTGTSSKWINISNGLDGSAVQKIVANPKRGSHEAYAVTLNGVYHMVDSSASNPVWQNITGNLFQITHDPFGDPSLRETLLKYLTTIVADWRFVVPDATGSSSTHPYLYVGGEGGVFRSTDNGRTWQVFPSVAGQGSAVDGGLLPVAHVTDLSLSVGNVNPATGQPNQATGFNLLLVTTYGRGSYAIRLETNSPFNPVSGPRVVSVTPGTPLTSLSSITITFDNPVDPDTFTLSQVRSLTGPNGPITPTKIVDLITNLSNPAAHTQFEIDFPTQTMEGIYTISIGPNIADFGGDLMNQNGNSLNGEDPGDRFTANFVVNTSDNGRFISGLFHDILNRPADTSSFIALLTPVDNARNAVLPQTAASFVLGQDYRTKLIKDGFQRLLLRPANPGDVPFWLNQFSNGTTREQFYAFLIGTPEYFNNPGKGNGSLATFINSAFLDIVNRPATTADVSFWTGVLQSGALSRQGMAQSLFGGSEYQTIVIKATFQALLNRPASVNDIAFWTNQLSSGTTTDSFIIDIAGTHESLYNNGNSGRTWLTTLFVQLLGRTPSTAELDAVEGTLLGLYAKSRQLAATSIELGPEYRAKLVSDAFQKFLLRPARPDDIAFWVNQLNNGMTREQFYAFLIGTPEYLNNPSKGNGDLATFINSVFQDIVNRPATTADVTFWTGVLQSGALSRQGMAQSLFGGSEYRTIFINAQFNTFVGKPPSSNDVAFWLNYFASGGTDEGMVLTLIPGQAYFDLPHMFP